MSPLGTRALAFVLDSVLVVGLFFAISHGWLALGRPIPGSLFYVIAALYLGLLPATPLQGTVGKRVLGLRICDRAGKRIGILRSLLRLAAFVPSIGIAGAGFVLAAFTPRRQALHDLAAGTFVVKRDATPEAMAEVPARVSTLNRASLIVGYAVLAWGVYTLWDTLDGRNRHDEAIALMVATHPYREEVAKALRSGGPMPVAAVLPRQARAMSAQPDGTIVIEVSDQLAPGARITLRPEDDGNGGYRWTCRPERIRYVPVECRTGHR